MEEEASASLVGVRMRRGVVDVGAAGEGISIDVDSETGDDDPNSDDSPLDSVPSVEDIEKERKKKRKKEKRKERKKDKRQNDQLSFSFLLFLDSLTSSTSVFTYQKTLHPNTSPKLINEKRNFWQSKKKEEKRKEEKGGKRRRRRHHFNYNSVEFLHNPS